MRLEINSDSGLVYATEVDNDLRGQAEILLYQLVSKEPKPDGGDLKVRLDWGIVKLVRRGNEVFVEEPDYRRDPLQFVPQLNFTCAVLRAQQLVHDRLGVRAEPVAYDNFLLVYPGGLTASGVAATRQPPRQPGDSGWRVFDATRIDWKADLQALRVYEIARERQAILSVLSLPVGWSVRLEDDTLVEAAPPDGEPIAVGMTLQISP
jgi:hypothetical protein